MEVKLEVTPSQGKFLESKKKFPCYKAAVGTGKTYMLLLAVMSYCKRYPGTTALIVRKEFTDLHDSTIRDFERYFPMKVGSDKNCDLPNGSKVMFRHAAEIEVLKNINLGIAGIEQAEEFEDDTQFQFIRDRLRQENGADIRPLYVIANANGHNWVYETWIGGAHKEEIDYETGQFHYTKGEYECVTANTFSNAHNLPPDFIEDCKRKEIESPNHYQQYILNNDDITQQDDFVYTFQELEEARRREFAYREGYGMRIAGFDIARFGNDKCACVCLEQIGALAWRVCHVEQWDHKDLNYTSGRILDLSNSLRTSADIIDEDGIGAGPIDTLNKGRGLNYRGFRNPPLSYEANKFYGNARTANAFRLKDLILKGHISLVDYDLCSELGTLKFSYDAQQRRILVSKDKMRKEGIKSPNLADALLMAISLIDDVKIKQEAVFSRPPQYSKEDNLFKLIGVR